jgi:hypothetical protein
VTVREWLESRAASVPPALTQRMVVLLGDDADADASDTPVICVRAAARTLEALVAESRFGRESALDLLATDALMTHAFEYASERAPTQIEHVATASTQLLAPLTTARV